MKLLPANAGWRWVKQGLQLFRKQPGALMAVFFCCMFLSLFLLVIPLLGGVAPLLLAPAFTVALLQACADIEQGKRALPNLVWTGLRKPARLPLLGLGVLYLLLMLVALAVLSWMDDGVMIRMALREIAVDEAMLEQSRGALFAAWTIYLLGWMLTSLAAPLIYWHQMPLAKALFFSVLTVSRAIKAYLMAALLLFLMFQAGSAIPVLLFDSAQLKVASFFSVFLLMVVVMHCALYASYKQLFAAPDPSPQEELPPTEP